MKKFSSKPGLIVITLFLLILLSCQKNPPRPPVILELRIADTVPVPGWEKKTIFKAALKVYVNPTPVLTAEDFIKVKATEKRFGRDSPVEDGAFSISFECNDRGAAKLKAATAANFRKRIAIVVDGRVILAPIIQSVLSEKFVLDGRFEREERDDLIDKFERAMDSVKE